MLVSQILIFTCYRKYLKKIHTIADKELGDWPARWAMAGLFSYHGDSLDSELLNLSTQLAKFPLLGCYHTSPTLKISHYLLGYTLSLYLSVWNSVQSLPVGKHHTNLAQNQQVTQSTWAQQQTS